jgi:hypothetical protein
MTQTLAQLRTLLRTRLDEPSESYWSDPDLTDFLNEACREIARRAMNLETLATFAVTAGKAAYGASDHNLTSLIMLGPLFYQPTGSGQYRYPLRYSDVNNGNAIPWFSTQDQTQATPEIFTAWGVVPDLQITLYPTPSRAGQIFVNYWRYPATLAADGDLAEIPTGWHDLAVTYAAYLGLLRDNDPRFGQYFQKFDADITYLISLSTRHTFDQGNISDSIYMGGGQAAMFDSYYGAGW